ncbi:uncharacterized protein LOC142771208 [Rhipicephalus microplus]|uniref:uncharacterized protein LOC142771208 n=1 Tax=Rhipicephalus microplus TaxID=6941 RepID=UPI003F6B866C
MSVESSLAFLDNVPRRRRTAKKGCSKGAATTGFAVLSLLGVCGIAVVLTLIMRDLREGEVKETASLEARRTAPPVAPVRKDAVRTQPAPGHQSKRMDSPSSGEVHKGNRHQGRLFNASRMATSTSPVTSGKSDNASDGYDIHGELDADSNNTLEHNGTIVTEETAPSFASGEDHYRVVSNGFDVSAEDADDAVMEDAKRDLQHSPLIRGGSDTSNPSRFQKSSVHLSTFARTKRPTTVTSTDVTSTPPTTSSASQKTTASIVATSEKHFGVQHATRSTSADYTAEAYSPNKHKTGSSAWLLFCFYDDRSLTRSPGFSVYDFPVQLCTDVALCCVDVNAKGKVVISKNLEQFINVMNHEFLPPSHLFLTLGGHRALAHHLDAALQNTARFATELADEAQRRGAGGLAVYLEDVELLKHAFRVHDLIMAVRGVSVAVVLPRDLRQQVRYYRTEIYANTKDMLVISPPSQGYDNGQLRPTFATCPHPRRSVHEGSSLEFIYQLSRTLLSSVADGSVDYASGNAATALEQPKAPRYLIGVSFGGLKFQLKNRSLHDVGSPATFVRRVPYREICSQPWHHWHDNVSECFVAWDGDRGWMSSLGPQSVGFTTELADGLAVFDLDFDDHRGECGNKFPVLRALRDALIVRHASKLA